METILRVLKIAISIYLTIGLVWLSLGAMLFVTGNAGATDPEGVAALIFAVFPISLVINLVLIFLLSILDKEALGIRFVIGSTAIGELATIVAWFAIDADLEVLFIVHILAIVICFFLWRRFFKGRF